MLAYTGKLRARCQSIREHARRVNAFRGIFNVMEKEHPEFDLVRYFYIIFSSGLLSYAPEQRFKLSFMHRISFYL